MRSVPLILVAVTLPCCVRCQETGVGPAFEVASVKPSLPASKPDIRRDPAGGFIAYGIPLKMLIILAYNIQDYQLANLPGGLGSDRYDVIGKSPQGAKKEQTWAMLQTLLADRFKPAIHREEKQLTTYRLVVSRKGLKIQESQQPPGEADESVKFGSGRLTCIKVPMPDLALALSEVVGRPVVDRTGVSGKYDFRLEWAPETRGNPAIGAGVPKEGERATPDVDGPSLFTALEDQLGLKLAPEKGPVEVVVIDHLEKPSPN